MAFATNRLSSCNFVLEIDELVEAFSVGICTFFQLVDLGQFDAQTIHFVRVDAAGAAVRDVPCPGETPAKLAGDTGNRRLSLPDPVSGRELPNGFLRFNCNHSQLHARFLQPLAH